MWLLVPGWLIRDVQYKEGSDATDGEALGRAWKMTRRGKAFIVFQSVTEHMIDLIYDYYKLSINWNPDSFLFMGVEMEY